MRISRVKLNNYVCFYDEDAEWVELGPGINFVVGKNNSGKTALLDALTPDVAGEVHKSRLTIPERTNNTVFLTPSEREVVYYLSKNEGTDFIRERYLLEIPIPSSLPFLVGAHSHTTYTDEQAVKVESYINEALESGFAVRVTMSANPLLGGKQTKLKVENFHNPDAETDHENSFGSLQISIGSHGDRDWRVSNQRYTEASQINQKLQTILGDKAKITFRFIAERRISSKLPHTPDDELKPDAENLAQVLNTLMRKREGRFNKYIESVRRVIPDLQNIRAVPDGEETATLVLDFLESTLEREDLGVPLDKCGTGVGQILALLYVVVAEDNPKIIIIDEPHSFLHPGAVRQLLKLFEEHDHHQYIIATHSPTALMAVKKKRILLVQREDMVSTVKSVAVDSNEGLEEALNEVGSRRSDIFGMDAVIWVEGKTDETCFKLIMDKAGDGLPFGTNISALVNADDLKSEYNAELAVEIYKSLSGGVGLLPSVLAFVFDGDKRGEHNLLTNTRYRIEYLPRQNYESYLIAPEILAEILNRDAAEDRERNQTADTVKAWIRENYERDYDDGEWLKTVDGAQLLDCMFDKLAGISYKDSKVAYGEEITRRILESDPAHFCEIVELIRCILHKDSEQ